MATKRPSRVVIFRRLSKWEEEAKTAEVEAVTAQHIVLRIDGQAARFHRTSGMGFAQWRGWRLDYVTWSAHWCEGPMRESRQKW